MKRFLVTCAAALLASTAAYSADAVVEDVVAVEVDGFTWSGFYIGGNVGYGWTSGDYDASIVPFESDGDLDGFLVGAYAGAQHQFSNNVVLGVEVDVQYRDGDDDADITVFGTPIGLAVDSELNWTGSARLKAGYAMDRWLPYIAGGFAFADYDANVTAGGINLPFSDFGGTSVGWTLGGGAEYAFTDNLIFRAEYRYSDFGSEDAVPLGFPYPGAEFDLDSHDVSLGVSYKF